jgi:hypothetical protein
MGELEGPDELITLRRAGELSGVSQDTLRHQSIAGKLHTRKVGTRMLMTTRRWLHTYLREASERDKGRRKPLPDGYVPPEDSKPAAERAVS